LKLIEQNLCFVRRSFNPLRSVTRSLPSGQIEDSDAAWIIAEPPAIL